jgi:transposase-like protein
MRQKVREEVRQVVKKSNGHQGRAYPLALREAALRDYLGGMSRSEVARKYSLTDSSVLSFWKRKFAASTPMKEVTKTVKRRNKRLLVTDMESAQAQKIKELERSLASAHRLLEERNKEVSELRLRNRVSETMIDLAEEAFEIPIRKNFGSK